VAYLVEVLRYKLEGRGFYSQQGDGIFQRLNLSMTLRSMVYLLPGEGGVGGGRGSSCVGLATLARSCADCLEVLGASASWRSKGLPKSV
jgi:hypothetical protein